MVYIAVIFYKYAQDWNDVPMKIRLALRAVVLTMAATAFVAACSSASQQAAVAVPASEAELRAQSLTEESRPPADPQGAADAIYETLTGRSVEKLDSQGLQNVLNISVLDTKSYLVYYSNPLNGLCDLAIIEPEDDKRDDIRKALFAYKESRMEEFRNYDILDSFEIAENAEIYEQDEYLILLMLPNNDAAQEIIDEKIPQ